MKSGSILVEGAMEVYT